MENEKKIRMRMMSGLLAVTLAGGTYFALKPTKAKATGSKIVTSTPTTKYKDFADHKIGEFYDENTGILYNTIEVIENDNASKLSEIIIALYNKEKQIPKEDLEVFDAENTKTSRSSFWPAVVYMNLNGRKKFRINPGDILIFPQYYSEFKDLNGRIKASGWYSRYLTANNIHPARRTMAVPKEEVRELLENIYSEKYPGEDICIDDDFLLKYLNAHSNYVKYVFRNNSRLDKEEAFGLVEWIPSLEQLETFLTPEEKEKKKIR